MRNARMNLSQSVRVAAVLEDWQHQLLLLAFSFAEDLNTNPHSPQDKVTLSKLAQDCHNIAELVGTFCVELQENQTFYSVLKTIEDVKQVEQMTDEHTQSETLSDYKENLTVRYAKVVEELENKCSIFQKLQEEHSILSAQREEQEKQNQTIKNEKKDKLQMLQKEASDEEKMLEKQIKLVKEQIEKERRSHDISMRFLQNQQEEMKQQKEMWKERIQIMRQDKAKELNDVRCKITLNLDRLMEMKRKFRVMEQVVKEDKEEQEKLRKELELITAATKIQAFWRGCMVRKGLGIYKTEEDKKGKKKDGSKEGKKKKKK
ncbi:unnamed protein product [Knipowitschia caucasica]|uniref:Dynein regulatory complex protein 9 n=1 Tax=Knipowitschia caucasica TaxID=637954 RepID=A0AAV2MBM0_KNICA